MEDGNGMSINKRILKEKNSKEPFADSKNTFHCLRKIK
jgi:hypothetical protein